ncbi:MAG: molybdopterin-guanine dinucleotide biosynthesis protein B [Cocleimonas sp.]|nr:molybdopterin-guanine dinucleotide biosynthesis protein B [Cocleimonas sp.]
MNKISLPLLGFAAYSGTGKTTLLCQLIPLLKEKGIKIGVIKHAHHHFDIDHPKKDSYELRKAGAETLLIASHKRTAIIIEHAHEPQDPSLVTALNKMPMDNLDLLLVEGFKHADFPKIELHRKLLEKPYLYPDDDNIIAIATDYPLEQQTHPPIPKYQFDINEPKSIADFIEANIMN